MWLGFAAYLAVLATAPALGRGVVWATIFVLVAGFAAAPVLLSHDVYSYVDYARLGVLHGLDPYLHKPIAAPGDAAFPKVEWTQTKSAYGPLFTLATYPLAWLPVGLAVAILKGVAAASVLATAALVSRLAAWRGADPLRAAAFVALNPLVLVHVVGGAHNDAVSMLLLTAGAAAMVARREAAAAAGMVAAAAAKVSASFIAPFALVAAVRRGGGAVRRLWAGALAAAVLIGAATWLAFGWNWLHGLGLAGENQSKTSHLSLPETSSRLTGLTPGTTRLIAALLFAALVVYLLRWTWRGGDWIRAAGWSAFGLLLATAWLLPWYVIWALPPAAVSRDRALQLLLLAFTAYQLGTRIPL